MIGDTIPGWGVVEISFVIDADDDVGLIDKVMKINFVGTIPTEMKHSSI